MASNSFSASSLGNQKKANFNRSFSATDLVPLGIANRDNVEAPLFLEQIHKAKNQNNLQGQFFTLSLLEYVCNVLNPRDSTRASQKFKGK